MKTLTITLNPVYDIYCRLPEMRLYKENLVTDVSVSPGGKGINVSRALAASGYDTTALLIFGKENCQSFENSLREEKIDFRALYVPGRVRENYTVIDDENKETRLCFNTFTADPAALDQILGLAGELVSEGDILVFSGKFPKGIAKDDQIAFLKKLKLLSPRVAVDSNSLTAEDVRAVKPWLIKPNEEEIEVLTGKKLDFSDPEALRFSLISSAKELRNAGIVNVLITLGGSGAVCAGEQGIFTAASPEITPLSTIGAGDSTIAGFISAVCDGLGGRDTLRRAMAFGSAACLREGTNPPLPADIENLFRIITVKNEE